MQVLEPTIHSRTFSDIDWEDILDTIAEQKCVLFLGNGAYKAPNGKDIETALCEWLDVTNPNHPVIRHYNPDGFFLFREKGRKRKVFSSIKDFFNQQFVETEKQFELLSQIPFPMIFTLTYDNIIARTFDKIGFDYHSDFYFKHRTAPNDFEKPNKNKPLIYNLMGNIEEPESLVLTHNDFFDYLNSIFVSKSMNKDLKRELEKAERYIFLGLPYEKWYFQMLLRILSLHSDQLKAIERTGVKEFEDHRLFEIYTEEFKIEFIPTNTDLFINELYERCNNKGLLKPLQSHNFGDSSENILSLEEMRKLLANSEILGAMNSLRGFLAKMRPKSNKLFDDLIIILNRYKILCQREQRGTIYLQDFNVELNQVLEQLLELITKAENL